MQEPYFQGPGPMGPQSGPPRGPPMGHGHGGMDPRGPPPRNDWNRPPSKCNIPNHYIIVASLLHEVHNINFIIMVNNLLFSECVSTSTWPRTSRTWSNAGTWT